MQLRSSSICLVLNSKQNSVQAMAKPPSGYSHYNICSFSTQYATAKADVAHRTAAYMINPMP